MRRCCDCNRKEDKSLNEKGKMKVELRPYGPGGQDICFECAMGSPERKKQVEESFGALLEAHEALPGITTLDVDGLGKL